MSLGYPGGTLACLGSCDYDTSGCMVVSCDPDGVYTKTGAPVSYTCCLGLVTVNVSSFIFSADGASILSSPSNPVNMTGAATTCPAGSFSNTGTVPGGCTEGYTLTGSFVDQNTWSGTYSLTFTGPDCSCFGGMIGTPCINQVFPVTAVR